jgi:hypothetical protein
MTGALALVMTGQFTQSVAVVDGLPISPSQYIAGTGVVPSAATQLVPGELEISAEAEPASVSSAATRSGLRYFDMFLVPSWLLRIAWTSSFELALVSSTRGHAIL